jgi:hypothetical protein
MERAKSAGVVRPDAQVDDVLHMITGIIGVEYRTDEQRERVLRMAIDGIRAR